MPDQPTPGQVAYTAYHHGAPLPWALLPAYEQAQWEAAAYAVRAHKTEGDHACPVCGAHDLASTAPGLTADGDVHRDMTCEDCGARWVNEYRFTGVRYVEGKEDTHA